MTIYLKVTYQNKSESISIQGDVNTPSHLDWISIKSLQHKVTKEVDFFERRNSTANRMIYTSDNAPVTFTKSGCVASFELFDLVNKADTMTVEIHIFASSQNGISQVLDNSALVPKVIYYFEGVQFTKYHASITEGGDIVENISFVYERISVDYVASQNKAKGFCYINHLDFKRN
jgi:type VI secretion system Hcp family effector